jgi:hypothetical protein
MILPSLKCHSKQSACSSVFAVFAVCRGGTVAGALQHAASPSACALDMKRTVPPINLAGGWLFDPFHNHLPYQPSNRGYAVVALALLCCGCRQLSLLSKPELELKLIQTHMTQKPVLRVEVGKGCLCGLISLGDSTSIYCFSALKQQKTDEITPDQRAFFFMVETTGTIATRVLIGSV